MNGFENVAKDYSLMASLDPIKQLVQYPSVLRLLGNVRKRIILDVGCGNGFLAHELSLQGARVVGFDISAKQVELAKLANKDFPENKFFVAYPNHFSYPQKFDAAFAAMVLLYSNDLAEMKSFFETIYSALKPGGFFVLLDLDINLLKFGVPQLGRHFSKMADNKIKIDFCVPNSVPFSSTASCFSKKEFADAASVAGFKKIRWENFTVLIKDLEKIKVVFGQDFFKESYWILGVFQK